jgi:carboxylesterase type B
MLIQIYLWVLVLSGISKGTCETSEPDPETSTNHYAGYIQDIYQASQRVLGVVNSSVTEHKLSEPTLQTRNGTYTGIYSPTYDQDYFLGIPYAQPPIDDLRWRLPQSVNTSFSGTKEAKSYSANCVGLGTDSWGYALSEDCLYLNVVRPRQPEGQAISDELLPIAVWIHGGGFYMGGSADRRFNLSMIVENGQKAGTPFIAISLNYRLNGWGFLYSNEVRGEGGTNLGLRDQRLALHWVSAVSENRVISRVK